MENFEPVVSGALENSLPIRAVDNTILDCDIVGVNIQASREVNVINNGSVLGYCEETRAVSKELTDGAPVLEQLGQDSER